MNTQHLDTESLRIWRSARPMARLLEGRNDWYRIENRAGAETAEVYIYDEIGYFGVTAKDFVNDLRNVSAKQINLHLNTPGGDVFDGIAIFNALKNHSATVNVHVDGLAASAGSFIAMAGDKVVMEPHSKMMIHEAFGLAIGNAEDMVKMSERLDATSQNIAAIYAGRTDKDAAFWRAQMKAETWYTDQEAVDIGLADEVGRTTKNQVNSFDLSIFKNPPEKDGLEDIVDAPIEDEDGNALSSDIPPPPVEEEAPINPDDGLTPARRELEAAIARVRL
jgi:ATP-dependent Clp endopeptidase proteolytic subunit ClpP